jgi:hypothetical protein
MGGPCSHVIKPDLHGEASPAVRSVDLGPVIDTQESFVTSGDLAGGPCHGPIPALDEAEESLAVQVVVSRHAFDGWHTIEKGDRVDPVLPVHNPVTNGVSKAIRPPAEADGAIPAEVEGLGSVRPPILEAVDALQTHEGGPFRRWPLGGAYLGGRFGVLASARVPGEMLALA